MSTKRWPKIAATIVALTGVGGGVAALSAASDANAARPVAVIVGTWTVTATPDNPAVPAFHSTLAYTDGGVVIEATGKPFGPTPLADTSEGLGVWQMDDSSTLHLTFVKYNYDANGQYIGTTTIVETDSVIGDRYNGHATATVRSPSGVVEASFGATSAGQRMTS